MKKILLVVLSIIVILGISACGDDQLSKDTTSNQNLSKLDNDVQKSDDLKIKDLFGREIILKKTPERVICIGPGALRLYTYVMGTEFISGVEAIETKSQVRPYNIAYPELKDIDVIGKGGPQNAPDTELISFNKPDVVFSTYSSSKEELDELSKQINTPVFGLNLGKNVVFEEDSYESMRSIGKIMGAEERASEVIDYMEVIRNDLKSRVANKDDSPEVYVGCIGFRGAHGILSTRANFNLLDCTNVNNIVDTISDKRNVMLDKEKLLELDPEIIFIDLGGEHLLADDYNGDKAFYGKLRAFNNNNVFTIIPYNHYTTNIDTAMIDMYYIAKVVYPDAYKDVDISQKAKEIYSNLLRSDNVYETMIENYPKAYTKYENLK